MNFKCLFLHKNEFIFPFYFHKLLKNPCISAYMYETFPTPAYFTYASPHLCDNCFHVLQAVTEAQLN